MESIIFLRDIYRAISELESEMIKNYGLSLNENMMLYSIMRNERLTSGDIAKALNMTHSNTSKIIRSAENRGYLERDMGEHDRRQMFFSLTTKGRNTLIMIEESLEDIAPELKAILNLSGNENI